MKPSATVSELGLLFSEADREASSAASLQAILALPPAIGADNWLGPAFVLALAAAIVLAFLLNQARRRISTLMTAQFQGKTPAPQAKLESEIRVREKAEEALRASEERLNTVMKSIAEVVWVAVPGKVEPVYLSPAFEKVWGRNPAELLNQPEAILKTVHPEDRDRLLKAIEQQSVGEPTSIEYRILLPDRSVRWIWDQGFPVRDAGGRVTSVNGIAADITERRLSETALHKSRRRYEQLVDAIPGIVWEADAGSLQFTFVSRQAERLLGYPLEQWLNEPNFWVDHLHPDDRDATVKYCLASTREKRDHEFEYRMVAADGRAVWLQDIVHVAVENDQPVAVRGIMVDITARKLAEAGIAERLRLESQLTQLVASAPGAIYAFRLRPDGRMSFPYVSPKLEEMFGLNRLELFTNATSAFETIHPDDVQMVHATIAESAKTVSLWHCIFRIRQPDEVWRRFEGRSSPKREEDGSILWHGFLLDITERKLAEDRLFESEVSLSRMGEMAKIGAWSLNLDTKRLWWSEQVYRIHELEPTVQPDVGQAIHYYAPEAREAIRKAVEAGIQEGRPWDLELPFVTARGKALWVRAQGQAESRDGRIVRLHGAFQDITQRKRFEFEREQLESQLRQSQKMEAIGTLAGGIAHDFNNILGAIFGNVALARMDLDPTHPARECVEEIKRAGERAKKLVQHILAFSRQQPHERRIISLTPLVNEVAGLLRASLPAGVELIRSIDEDVPSVLAESSQIHQVLMNLGTNAWHALEGGTGRVEIKLRRVNVPPALAATQTGLTPGPHVCLSVIDNGRGMDPDTLERIFDPFFTTKSTGQGTGLGLSVVHGIVKEHQGAIIVTSQPGKGSTFDLYFPIVRETTQEAAPQTAEMPRGSGQRILYLDDEPPLVQLATNLFQRLGYRVTGFTNPRQAVEAFRACPDQFDLVVTDHNMPGVSGIQVAADVLSIRPNIPVVLTSGYVTDELKSKAEATGIRHVVYKPNTTDDLCQAIHRLVSAPQQS